MTRVQLSISIINDNTTNSAHFGFLGLLGLLGLLGFIELLGLTGLLELIKLLASVKLTFKILDETGVHFRYNFSSVNPNWVTWVT